VATVSPSGTTVYTDPNNHDEDTPEYIFVPSARAHRELTDEQLLSGEWHTGRLVGGDPSFCELFCAHARMQGRACSVVATSPEALVSRPRVMVRTPPHFVEWFRLNALDSSIGELAEMMGAPVFPVDAAPANDSDVDAIAAYAAVTRSEEACVDGVRGLKLELKCNEQLMRGELSIPEARRIFLTHYDGLYEEVKRVQQKRFTEWCDAWCAKKQELLLVASAGL